MQISEKDLCQYLLDNKLVKKYDCVDYTYPMARYKTLINGIGHHPVNSSGKVHCLSTKGAGGIVVEIKD